jgi:hypothetical protein
VFELKFSAVRETSIFLPFGKGDGENFKNLKSGTVLSF